MKISSASKKVLASALSAAMVVAFAPTVAFAADGDKCPVTIDVDGGTVTSGNVSFDNAKVGDVISLPTLDKGGYSVDHFWYDADEDGVDDGGQEDATTTFTVPDKSGVTLKAVYKTPTLGDVTFAQAAEGSAASIVVNYDAFTAQNTKENASYTLSIKKDGAADALYSWDFAAEDGDAGHKHAVVSSGAKTLSFKDNVYTGEDSAVLLDNLTSGKYTVELSDGTSVVSTKTLELVKVTLDGTDGKALGAFFYSKKAGFDQSSTAFSADTYVDADGYVFDNAASKKVSGDVTVTKSAATSSVTDPSYDDGVVHFTVKDSAAANAKDKFDVAVTDSAGATVWSASVKGDVINGTSGEEFAFSFDSADPFYQHAATSQVAGKYTVTVVKTPAEGDATTVKAVAFTLTELKYSAGDNGKLKGSLKKASDVFVTDATPVTLDGNVVEAGEGYSIDTATGWLLNGKKINAATNPVKTGAVNELVASYKAVTADPTQVATPAVASVERAENAADKTSWDYTVKLTCATAGAAITYSTGVDTSGTTTAYTNAGIKVTAKKNAEPVDVYVVASPSTGATDSTIKTASKLLHLTFNDEATGFASYTAGASSYLEKYVGKSTTKWLAVDGVKAAIESGSASLSALGYYVEYGSKAVAKAEVAAYKALYEAVDAEANAQLAAYADEAPVVSGTKAYYMTAADYKTAKAAVAAVEKAVAAAEKADSANKGTYTGAIYDGTDSLIDVINKASNYTESKVAAADITAAAAVTEQLKAAKDATAAKAAIEAYNKLTDAQKALVATADVTAAQAIVTEQEKKDAEAKAAEQLKDAQDLAAARDLNGKRVVAKAKVGKKAKGKAFTYALAASESGATGTYAKVSGSKYIKVSAAGKVTFTKVKVAKKAKTFKATVSVTFGTQTVTKTVKYVVKKK